MPDYKILEVRTKKDLKRFIKFPDRLYKDCKQYVPALHSDQMKSLTSCAPLEYCTAARWIVTDGNKVVGRISAMINPRYNERYGTKRARFGWFDTINDIEVARMLLSTAEKWAVEHGMDEVHGPLYYNTLGKQGMLIEGFENVPPFNCIYNYPYYNELVTALGYGKECDWVQYEIYNVQNLPEKTYRVGDMIKRRYNLHIGNIDVLKKDPAMVRKFFDIYNRSFAEAVYNFIPFTEKEMEEEASEMLKFVTDRTSSIVLDENDNPIAFGILFPSISEALRKAKGHLFPFGWIHMLKAMHSYEVCDLMLNGAAPEWQNKGVSAVYFCDMSVKSARNGLKVSISNPQIEDNPAVNIWKSYDHKMFMRRRCYIKKLTR